MVRCFRGVLAFLLVALVLVSGSPVQAQTDGPFARFAGKWVGRPSFALTIRADGYAEAEWRLYGGWCGEEGVKPPCDELGSDVSPMRFGGHAVYQFTNVVGDTANGTIRASTYADEMTQAAAQVAFTLRPNEFALLEHGPYQNQLCTFRYAMEGNNGVWDREC